MGRPTGLEPSHCLEAKSLENADLVEGQFLENGNKVQREAVKGSQKHQSWQPHGNLGLLVRLAPGAVWRRTHRDHPKKHPCGSRSTSDRMVLIFAASGFGE